MNSIDSLSHASKFKHNEDMMGIQQDRFSTIQNSTRRHEGWHGDDSLQLLLWTLEFIANWNSSK
jgi:hypothetical protein